MIKCICIDDKGKPNEIPASHWVKKGQKYHINYVYNMILQGGILGVTLNEIDLMGLKGLYECFKITRFAFKAEDLAALFEMFRDCAELGKINIEEMIKEQCELVELEDGERW